MSMRSPSPDPYPSVFLALKFWYVYFVLCGYKVLNVSTKPVATSAWKPEISCGVRPAEPGLLLEKSRPAGRRHSPYSQEPRSGRP